jgi:sulfur-carrier protein
MKVTVKLFATLRDGLFDEEVREYGPGTTVASIINELKLPLDRVKVVFVNNRHAAKDRELKDGDILALFPPTGGG